MVQSIFENSVMDVTPKLQKKASLSLSSRLKMEKYSASPKNCLKISEPSDVNSHEQIIDVHRSPSVVSFFDSSVECTPPNKKTAINLNESLEISPKIFDNSFSPNCLLSQTLATESPEVGWKWNRLSANSDCNQICGTKISSACTTDSTHAVDKSLSSSCPSGTDIFTDRRGCFSNKQRDVFDAHRENRRHILEMKFRRVEKMRADEKLKQRCAILQEQLRSIGEQQVQSPISEENQVQEGRTKIIPSDGCEMERFASTSSSMNVVEKLQTPGKLKKCPELISDFLNDSELDSFLLQATQEIESKIEAKTEPACVKISNTSSSGCTSIPLCNSAPAAASATNKDSAPTENSNSNEEKKKRHSFYMKFLEDDSHDDWFMSLDEVILQATQNQKSRNSLQRYNSMPAETATKSNAKLNINNDDAISTSSTLSRIKRHSSTHSLSPTTNRRSRR